MRTNTNLRISHTVYPDGLRIYYDYVPVEQTFMPTIKHDKFSSKTVKVILILLALFIYLLL